MAPYWADVDTRGTGQIFYRQSTDPSLLTRASNEVQAAFPDSDSIRITNLFIATWDAVGYYIRGIDKVTIKFVIHNIIYFNFNIKNLKHIVHITTCRLTTAYHNLIWGISNLCHISTYA